MPTKQSVDPVTSKSTWQKAGGEEMSPSLPQSASIASEPSNQSKTPIADSAPDSAQTAESVTDEHSQRYKNKSGLVLPSVTTIIKSSLGGWGLQGLMNWAANEAKEGRDHNATRDAAADVGTIVHRQIEAFVTETEPDLDGFSDETLAKAETPFDNFLGWYTANDIRFEATEKRMISEIHGFGGTMDALARVNGKQVIIDYKSSKSIYASILAQLGAYSILLEETEATIVMDAIALHIGKDGQFGIYQFKHEDLYQGRTLFHHAASIYKLEKSVSKRVKEQAKLNEQRYGAQK